MAKTQIEGPSTWRWTRTVRGFASILGLERGFRIDVMGLDPEPFEEYPTYRVRMLHQGLELDDPRLRELCFETSNLDTARAVAERWAGAVLAGLARLDDLDLSWMTDAERQSVVTRQGRAVT